MSSLRGEALYRAALERLIDGTPEIVDIEDPDFKFNNDTVCKEAGMDRGRIKAARWPDLCADIQAAEEERQRASKDFSQKQLADKQSKLKDNANARYSALKEDFDRISTQLINVVNENYHLRQRVKELELITGGNVRSIKR